MLSSSLSFKPSITSDDCETGFNPNARNASCFLKNDNINKGQSGDGGAVEMTAFWGQSGLRALPVGPGTP